MRLALLVIMLAASHAWAIGFCENTPRHYGPPKLVHEADQVFALPATQAWCDETGGVETRGVVSFVELRDANGDVKGVLSTAKGAAAKRLEKLVGSFEAVKSIDATLRARQFQAIASRNASCVVKSSWTKTTELVNGFPASTLGVDVLTGKQRLASMELGLAATQRRAAVSITAHFAKANVVVFARVPICNGPPPGRFGPDDAGECYTDDEPVIKVFDAAQIAACFKAGPASGSP